MVKLFNPRPVVTITQPATSPPPGTITISGQVLDWVSFVPRLVLNGDDVSNALVPDTSSPPGGPYRSTFSTQVTVGAAQTTTNGEDDPAVYGYQTGTPGAESFEIMAVNCLGCFGLHSFTLTYTVSSVDDTVASTQITFGTQSPPQLLAPDGYKYFVRIIGIGSVPSGAVLTIDDFWRTFTTPLLNISGQVRTTDLLCFAPIVISTNFNPTDTETVANLGFKLSFSYSPPPPAQSVSCDAGTSGELLVDSSGTAVQVITPGKEDDILNQTAALYVYARVGRDGSQAGSQTTVDLSCASYDDGAIDMLGLTNTPPTQRTLTYYRQSDDPTDPLYNLYLTAPSGQVEIPILPVNVEWPAGVDDSTYGQYEMFTSGGVIRHGPTTKPRAKDATYVIITLDDGPHAAALVNNPQAPDDLNRKNYTERWLDFFLLEKWNGEHDKLAAAFFVQTDSRANQDGTGPYIHGKTPNGTALLVREFKENHVIGIHTGSDVDHALFPTRVTSPAYGLGGANGLEDDLIRAATFLTGPNVGYKVLKYVRAPGFNIDKKGSPNRAAICATFKRRSLTDIGTNIAVDTSWNEPMVPIGTSEASCVNVITSGKAKQIYQTATGFVVFLFHDIKSYHPFTAAAHYLQAIRQQLEAVNRSPVYPTKAKIEAVFDNNRFGTRCP